MVMRELFESRKHLLWFRRFFRTFIKYESVWFH